jgi:hypothetical protein
VAVAATRGSALAARASGPGAPLVLAPTRLPDIVTAGLDAIGVRVPGAGAR